MEFGTSGLQLQSISGNSGKAYKGLRPDGTHVFVKYEMPAIVPALAREQLTPPILSTNHEVGVGQRIEQEWLVGRTLERQDMTKKQVRQMLMRLHFSHKLVKQALRLHYTYQEPSDLVKKWQEETSVRLSQNHYLRTVCEELLSETPRFDVERATLVHGDLHHKNWVETQSGLIYLTDWDTACLTDRMADVALLLTHYIPRPAWREWLRDYGYNYNRTVVNKIYWYGQLAYLNQIHKAVESYNTELANREIYGLRQFRETFYKEI